MTYDADRSPTRDEAVRRVFLPQEAALRAAGLRALGLGEHPEPELDEFARLLAQSAGAPLAMVNFLGADRQYFAGLHAPSMVRGGPGTAARADDPARYMDKDQGWCPLVVARRKSLVLDDVCDYPRFAGNPVVDQFGIRSYLGAPILDRPGGTVVGTVCAVDTEPHDWGGTDAVDYIKERAAQAMGILAKRQR